MTRGNVVQALHAVYMFVFSCLVATHIYSVEVDAPVCPCSGGDESVSVFTGGGHGRVRGGQGPSDFWSLKAHGNKAVTQSVTQN